MKTILKLAGVVAVFCLMADCSKAPEPVKNVIPTQAAEQAFQEAARLCKVEGGKLWGHSLCGPMMFVDPGTHQAVLNEASPGTVKDGSLFRLVLPEKMGSSNTSVELDGKRWTMIIWPLPENKAMREILMMHESYHRIQPEIGLEAQGDMGSNLHLDTKDGRVWMRAEFNVLSTALGSEGEMRRTALSDALLFRAYRQSLWPEAAEQERHLELNEGLAESTGIDAVLTDSSQRVMAAMGELENCKKNPTFVRSFAYGTGPAYAELLNAANPDWRKGIGMDFDFAKAVASAYKLEPASPSEKAAMAAIAKYNGAEIISREDARQKTLDARNARFKKLLIDGPTVHIHLLNMSIHFDPLRVSKFGDHGSVYDTVKFMDDWGTLEVQDGAALVSKNFREVYVPATPETGASNTSGDGWKLTLDKGYVLAPDPGKPGSFRVVKK